MTVKNKNKRETGADVPVFQHLQQGFYIPAGGSPDESRLGYLLSEVPGDPPSSITLSQSLDKTGFYLFVPRLPGGDALKTFIDRARDYLNRQLTRGTRFAWFPDPGASGIDFTATTLQVKKENDKYITVESVFIRAASNIQLRIDGGNEITLKDDTGLCFTPPGGDANALYVTPRGSGEPQTLPLTTSLGLSMLNGGAVNGCFDFNVDIDAPWLDYLDIGLRYFVPDPDWSPYVLSLRSPIFDGRGGFAMTLASVLDPLDALDADRTFFKVAQPGKGDAVTPYTSYFRSVLGNPVTLTPTVSSRFVFSGKITTVPGETSNNGDPLYLVPDGDFNLNIQAGTESGGDMANLLMCGFSGVEYIDLSQTAGGAVITFRPGNNAYSPAQKVESNGTAGTQTVYQGLTPGAKTSWAYIHTPSRDLDYYAQPDSAVMYAPGSIADFLTYKPLLAGALKSNVPSGAFPMVPYAGLEHGSPLLETFRQLEIQAVNPIRRAAIYRLNPDFGEQLAAAAGVGDSPPDSTTPQGMLLQTTGQQWTSLTLAQSPYSDKIPDTPTRLGNVKGKLQAALQSNQLFLVVTDPFAFLENCDIPDYMLTMEAFADLNANGVKQEVSDKLEPLQDKRYNDRQVFLADIKTILGDLYTDALEKLLVTYGAFFQVTVQGWHFNLSPAHWLDHNSIVIFKFYKKSLADLVHSTDSWAQADAFNDEVSAVQQQLLAFLEEARESANPALDKFKTVVDNPNWNGILSLRCTVPLSGLPPQLMGLAAGIDASRFFAHHIGIDINPVHVEKDKDGNEKLTISDSSIFGLINYQDKSELGGSADYLFKVNTLNVLFNNSEVTDFSSEIELLINKLFAQSVSRLNSSNNNLKMQGVYQQHDGSGSYVFGSTGVSRYAVTGKVLKEVEIAKAQFSTVVPQDGFKPDRDVVTRFTFWGQVDFHALEGFDMFSFGTAEGSAGPSGGLSYSGLQVNMSFLPTTPSYKTFVFNAGEVTCDTATSTVRPGGLYRHFPLTLTGLVQGKEEGKAGDNGYMPVDSPLQGSQLSFPWFGLAFDLNLGSFGALAGKAGFTAGLLLAWAPDVHNYKVFIGLRLPGVSGGKREISIEGVIKLTFGDVRFVVNDTSYILQLRNIALGLLSISFPPGQTDFTLFGDPAGKDNSTLGWYAAYKKAGSDNSGKKGKNVLRSLP